MRRFFSTIPVYLMLVILVASQGYWSFGSKWLAHELDHEKNPEVSVAAQHHAVTNMTGIDADDDPDQLTDGEHSLLHATAHLQPFSLPGAALAYPIFLGIAIVVMFFVLSPPASRHIERLFRPPRSLH
jgi:hypothetical protein